MEKYAKNGFHLLSVVLYRCFPRFEVAASNINDGIEIASDEL